MYKHLFFPFFLPFIILILSVNNCFSQSDIQVKLKWLGEDAPKKPTGVSWGVPFQRNEVTNTDKFYLENSDGKTFPVQSWPMAYWPDGSVKWSGFSIVSTGLDSNGYQLKKSSEIKTVLPSKCIITKENDDSFIINTGIIECSIPKKGYDIISSIKINDSIISRNGKLVCILQDGPGNEYGKQPDRKKFTSYISRVTLEQKGPFKAVIKIEGTHKEINGKREWLPFVVRLYMYANLPTIKIVHTIIYDGEAQNDFITGLGIEFEVPMNEETHNRHIRFSGEKNGLWCEPVKPLTGRVPFIEKGVNLYEDQLKGKAIGNRDSFDNKKQFLLDNWASWNDFKLVQNNADGFLIYKRTNKNSAWINAGSGQRSKGLAFLGDISGGLGFCVKNFWQSYPSMLEIKNACSDKATITAWLWSPDNPPMDMRNYDTLSRGHNLDASYEDVQPGFSTPTGIARTSELLIFASKSVPDNTTLNYYAETCNNSPILVCSPEYLHSVPVFGIWSLPDTSSKGKKWIETQLNNAFNYYKLEVEQRNWYGYWDYGDIMHSYDPERHTWRYDIGGYAWDNTELMPNLWLWYSFLRTGRSDIFKTAEAMTRHTSEVDVYHLGRFKGLGSRHNVRHWGCGAKEVRISQAELNRFYYYLTTDERTGDLMSEVTEAANTAIGELDPLRLILKPGKYPTHARIGPDWFALAGNWMTEWERTGNNLYKKKIETGIEDLSKMPYGLFSGKDAALEYNPENNNLYQIDSSDIGYLHLMILMGGPEVVFELNDILDNPDWMKMWLQFCRLYGQPKEIKKEFGQNVKLGDRKEWSARLPAYYYYKTKDAKYAEYAWEQLLDLKNYMNKFSFNTNLYSGNNILEPVYEIPHISTNYTAQWCLNAIQVLELAGDKIPEKHYRFDNETNPKSHKHLKRNKP